MLASSWLATAIAAAEAEARVVMWKEELSVGEESKAERRSVKRSVSFGETPSSGDCGDGGDSSALCMAERLDSEEGKAVGWET